MIKGMSLVIAFSVLLIILMSPFAAAGKPGGDTETKCSDGRDNDRDGLIDCDDPDCLGTPECSCTINENPEISCGDGVDNDCDGLMDCDDPDCAGSASCNPSSGNLVIIAYNDLGMHCACPFGDYMILLPPWNTVRAQIIEKGSSPVVSADDAKYVVEYNMVENTDQSLNSDPAFQGWLDSMCYHFPGNPYACNWQTGDPIVGLTGAGLYGHMEARTDIGAGYWIVEGVPAFANPDPNGQMIFLQGTPWEERRDPYLTMDVMVKDKNTGAELASTSTVVPVSYGGCCECHLEDAAATLGKPDPTVDEMWDVMTGYHYNDTGVEIKSLTPIRCSKCHFDPAVEGNTITRNSIDPDWEAYGKAAAGVSEISSFSKALHTKHGSSEKVRLYEPDIDFNCYICHPGNGVNCYRGHHLHRTTGKGGSAHEMWCTDCHGTISERIATGELNDPWSYRTLPECGDCHSGGCAEPRNSAPALFGKYLGSGGHKNDAILCSTCHGQPHALGESNLPDDNEQNIALQSDPRSLGVCDACHTGKSSNWGTPPH